MSLDNMKHELLEEYKNIRIRPVEECDLEFLRRWRNNIDNTKYLSRIPYITSDMQMLWYRKSLYESNEYVFAIDEIQDLKRVVGSLALYNITDASAEFGKILIGDPDAHGRKVGVHSLIALMKIGFNRMGLKKIFLHVYKENKAAVHVYKQVGFGIIEETMTGSSVEFIMSISRDEFKTLGVE